MGDDYEDDDDEEGEEIDEEKVLDIAEECFKRINLALDSYNLTIIELF
jgi:hypothetical protein